MIRLVRIAMTPAIVRASMKVALVVGTILNTVNQGEALLRGGSPSWIQVALNFVVPFCVSAYSAANNQLNRRQNRDD